MSQVELQKTYQPNADADFRETEKNERDVLFLQGLEQGQRGARERTHRTSIQTARMKKSATVKPRAMAAVVAAAGNSNFTGLLGRAGRP